MILRRTLASLAIAIGIGIASHSQATAVNITDNAWHAFDVDDLTSVTPNPLAWIDLNDGSALTFQFFSSGPVALKVVDAGFAGDIFSVYDNNVLLGSTGPATNSYPQSVITNFDSASQIPQYSQATFLLGAGAHSITGVLTTSALDDVGSPINATVGAVMLQPVPEPETWALMAAGLALVGFAARGRNVNSR